MTLAEPVLVRGRPARLLFVHAHPDDESLATGVAIAHHVAAGDEVHVLTCSPRVQVLSLIHISEPTRRLRGSRMPSSA